MFPTDRPNLMVEAGLLDVRSAQLLEEANAMNGDNPDFRRRWSRLFGAFFAAGG
jgi:hypothetical protein